MSTRSMFALAATLALVLASGRPSQAVLVQRVAGVSGPAFGTQQAIVTIEVKCNRRRACPDLDTALQELLVAHPTELRIVYDVGATPNDSVRAQAMLEAWEQGLFLEFRRHLMRTNRYRGLSVEMAAHRAGMNVEALARALKAKTHLPRVRHDRRHRQFRPHQRTSRSPRIFYNGQGYAVRAPFGNQLEIWFRGARQQAQKYLDRGVPLAALSEYEHPPRRDSHRRRSFSKRWNGTPRQTIDEGQSPTRGPKDADITIITFFSFPHAQANAWIRAIEDVRDQYPNRIRVVHKYYVRHGRQAMAAQVLACAELQNKAWAYIDASRSNFTTFYDHRRARKYLAAAGVDLDQLDADLAKKRCQAPLDADHAEVVRLGIRQDTWFVNGRKVPRNDTLLDIVEEELRPGLLQQLRP